MDIGKSQPCTVHSLSTHSWFMLIYTDLDKIKDATFNLLKPTGYVMHQQFNIQQL
jgi:hypothetical protein